jgi:hypothetical protein
VTSIGALKFEAVKKERFKTRWVIGWPPMIEGKMEGRIMNLSVEAKVAIAVATSFVVLIVGVMAQG